MMGGSSTIISNGKLMPRLDFISRRYPRFIKGPEEDMEFENVWAGPNDGYDNVYCVDNLDDQENNIFGALNIFELIIKYSFLDNFKPLEYLDVYKQFFGEPNIEKRCIRKLSDAVNKGIVGPLERPLLTHLWALKRGTFSFLVTGTVNIARLNESTTINHPYQVIKPSRRSDDLYIVDVNRLINWGGKYKRAYFAQIEGFDEDTSTFNLVGSEDKRYKIISFS